MNLYVLEDIRTNRFTDTSMKTKIENAMKEANARLMDESGDRFIIYTDYETDYKGDFSLAIATQHVETNSLLVIDERNAFKMIEIDAEDPHGIENAWKSVWRMEETGVIKRAYTLDFLHIREDGTQRLFVAVE